MNAWVILFLVLFIAALGTGIIVHLDFIINSDPFFTSNVSDYPKISFSSFKSFYEINPHSWHLYYNYVEKDIYFDAQYKNCDLFCSPFTKQYSFSLRDYYFYRKWRAQKKAKDKAICDAKDIEVLTKSVRHDIEIMESKSSTEFKTAKSVVSQVSSASQVSSSASQDSPSGQFSSFSDVPDFFNYIDDIHKFSI